MSSYCKVTLKVTDTDTGAVPDGIKVWQDGQPLTVWDPAALTWVTSMELVVYLGKNTFVWVQADGYQGKNFTIAGGFADYTFECPLERDPDTLTGSLTIRVLPGQVSGVDITLVGNGDKAYNRITSGGEARFENLPLGDYNLTGTYPPGYEDITDAVSFAGGDQQQEYTIVSKPVEGKAPVAEEEPADDLQQLAEALPPTLEHDISEDIYGESSWDAYFYGESSWDAYFTGAQVRVYIGNLFVDELQAVQYRLGNNVVPFYGYASRFADAYADGKSLVQGQLILNYISEGYLYSVLDEWRSRNKDPREPEADSKDAADLTRYLAARKRAGRATSDGIIKSAAYGMSLDTLLRNPEAVRQARRRSGAAFDPVYINACYQPVTFDLAIEIGSGNYRTNRRIEMCRLTTNEQVLDESGQVIADAYGFIGRRLR